MISSFKSVEYLLHHAAWHVAVASMPRFLHFNSWTLNSWFNWNFPGGLSCKRPQEPLDGIALVLGIQTLLKQFHPEVAKQFLLYISQFVKSHIDAIAPYVSMKLKLWFIFLNLCMCVLDFNQLFCSYRSGNKAPTELSPEVMSALYFLEAFTKVSGQPRQALSTHIPNTILDLYQVLGS